MAVFEAGKDAVLLGDEVALTGSFSNVQVKQSVQILNANTFGNNSDVIKSGLGSGTLTLAGLFDATAGASDPEMWDSLGQATGNVVTVGYGGLAVGDRTSMLQVRTNSYNIGSPVKDLVRINATFDSVGRVQSGVSLHALTAETIAGDYASVDQLASTALGGICHLHVSAFTGTDCVLSVQDSADDAVWADLKTFTTVTGVTQERSTVAAGTVNRYVRATIESGTFSSITFNISFGRNYRS